MSYFIHVVLLNIFLGTPVWAGICAFLETVEHLSRPFWLLVSIEKSGVIVMSLLLLYYLVFFPFVILCCSICLVFWLLCDMRGFFFLALSVWYSVCFLYLNKHLLLLLGKFSMILLKIFPVSLTSFLFLFSISVLCRLSLYTASQIFLVVWM